MVVAAVVHGLALSLGLIAARGPQNVFVLQQGAAQPRLRRALPTVVAAGLADTLLIGLGVAGVSLLVLERPWLRSAMLAGGVLFLLYVGWTLLRASPLGVAGDADPLDAGAQAGFAVSVSLLNPTRCSTPSASSARARSPTTRRRAGRSPPPARSSRGDGSPASPSPAGCSGTRSTRNACATSTPPRR